MWQLLESQGEDKAAEFQLGANEFVKHSQSGTTEDLTPSATLKYTSTPWILEEWRRVSIPEWRRILREAEAAGDNRRKKYAQWMLSEVLESGTSEDCA